MSILVWLVGSEAVRSAREEPPGRPLVAVEQKRAFYSRTIGRPCSMRQGERGELGKCARREVHGVAATFGIVDSEYGDGAQVYSFVSSERFGRWQQAVHKEPTHRPRYEFTLPEADSMPLIVEGHTAFLADSDSRSIGDYPHLRCARAVGGGAGRFIALVGL